MLLSEGLKSGLELVAYESGLRVPLEVAGRHDVAVGLVVK